MLFMLQLLSYYMFSTILVALNDAEVIHKISWFKIDYNLTVFKMYQ